MSLRTLTPDNLPRSSLLFILQRKYAPYIFISPFFILFVVFGLFPMLFSLYLSFHKWSQTSGLSAMQFNGLENYTFTLFRDPWFWKSVWNTLVLGFYGLLIQPVAIVLAFAFQVALGRWKNVVTTAYFVPYITATVPVAMVFGMLFSRESGILNALLAALNTVPLLNLIVPDAKVDWLGNPATIKPAIAFLVAWQFLGWNIILYLARIQAIPRELYEAAEVDGATILQQFWFVTLPQLRTMMFLTVTLTIIGQMSLFDQPLTLVGQNGGVGQAGMTIGLYLYNTAFKFGEMGTAAAMGWILFAFILILNVINNRIFGANARAKGE
jgi:multiple sugar transport system permease protein